MRIETWEIMQNADLDEIELQLAFQCAPLITGLKVSNLFQIDSRHYKRLGEILDKSNFSFCGLGGRNGSVSLLIYQKEWLEQFLQQEEVRILMHRLGYRDLHLERVLTKFRSRYIRYMQKKQQFPHEMGVLLGYPPEDVEGFIIYEGKNSLCEGYWKVYAEPQKKLRLFAQYDKAREWLLDLLYCGVGMEDIVGVALDAESRAISQDYLFAS